MMTSLATILAIDDESEILALLTDLLKEDFTLQTAQSGPEGLKKTTRFLLISSSWT